MYIIIVLTGSLLLLTALAGCVVPFLIGPPLAYAAILLLHFSGLAHFSAVFLALTGALTLTITMFDDIFPAIGARHFGGGTRAVIGSMIGYFAGFLIMPPFGIIIGAFTGAFIGELTAGFRIISSLKVSIGALAGFVFGITLKITVVGIMIFYFISSLAH
jgi:uncharacterized protein YqgC (DUF456 family)